MNTLKELIKSQNLAPFLSREEMLDILQREEYGYLPPTPDEINFEVLEEDRSFCNSKAIFKKISARCIINGNCFSFPFYSVIPHGKGKFPLIVHLKFGTNVSDIFMPSEEIADERFACLSFCYKDVTSDDGDMTNGLAGVLYENGRRRDSDAGKIAMWAWAAHRLMDYAQTVSEIDATKSVVCGHSRLGKTALLAGATDERFAITYSNNSGCSGAALYKDKDGENIEAITNNFPYWFCENFLKYRGLDENMPFDQHYLTACIAPRRVYIASAEDDIWAGPKNEFLNCVAVSGFYEKLGVKGFVCKDEIPEPLAIFHEGNVAYHIRKGKHCFGHDDWHFLLDYAKESIKAVRK